jgi:hypothetical protein
MKLQFNKVLKDGLEILTPADFATKYGKGVQKEAIYYAMNKGLVDYISIGKRLRLVVTTNHTMQYTPNNSRNRATKKPVKKVSGTAARKAPPQVKKK